MQYPFPKTLMPFQYDPFNGDRYIKSEILKLKDKYKIDTVVETGTCLGSSSVFFLDNFHRVFTCEVCDEFADYAEQRLNAHMKQMAYDKVFKLERQSSPDFIRSLSGKLKRNTFFFLDAHWGDHCPLADELAAIAEQKIAPIIAIHDWQVPMTHFGYDEYNGVALSMNNYSGAIFEVYKWHGGYDYYYNDVAEGAIRGIVYIVPKIF